MGKQKPLEKRHVNNELYVTETQELRFTKDDFHPMGKGNYYPNKALTGKIGQLMGIEFSPTILMETIYGDIVISPDGSQTKKAVGIRCVKQGKKRNVDGTFQHSSPCSYTYNYADRAELEILRDFEKGYNKYNIPNDKAREKMARKKLLLELRQYADQRASTGAMLMVIRELTTIKTSFTMEDINKGTLECSQIILSDQHQGAIAKANIDNIKNGNTKELENSVNLLTGQNADGKYQMQPSIKEGHELPITNSNKEMPEVKEPKKTPTADLFLKAQNQEVHLTPKQEFESKLIDSSLDNTLKNVLRDQMTKMELLSVEEPLMYKYATCVLNSTKDNNWITQIFNGVAQRNFEVKTLEHVINSQL